MDVRALGGFDYRLGGSGQVAVADVVLDGVVEEGRVLGHDADGAAERVQRHGPDVLAVDGDGALLDVVGPEQ